MKMANLAGIFNNEDTQNWFAACLATKCCREGLLDLVATVGQCLQTQVIQNAIASNNLPRGTVCANCPTHVLGVIPCRTIGVCKRDVNGQCVFHKTPQRPCPKNLCNAVVKEIKSCHRFHGPSWRNTHADQWTVNPFEILKCFMPVEGYIDKGSAAVTDFNGLINVVINCKLFENYFSSDLKQTTNVCTEARDVTRDLRHNADFKLDRVKLNKVYDVLLALLNDSKFLSTNQTAQDAFKKISELKANKLTITPININAVLDDIKDCRAKVIKQMTEDAAKAIARVTDEKVKDAGERISNTTDKKVKEAAGRISDTTNEKVKEAGERISHTTDEKVKDAGERISHTTDEKVKEATGRISDTTNEKVKEAAGRISDTTNEKVKEAAGRISDTTNEKVKEATGRISDTTNEKVKEAAGRISDRTNEKVKEAAGRISDTTNEKVKEATGRISDTTDEKVKEAAGRISDTTEEKVKEATGRISDTTNEKVKEAAGRISDTTNEKVKEAGERISHTSDEKVKDAGERISHTTDEKVKEATGRISDTTNEKVKEAAGRISDTTDEKVKEATGRISDTTNEKVKEAAGRISDTTNEKVKEAAGRISDTTDEKVKEATGRISDTTNEKMKEAAGRISDTTDEKVKEAEGEISHVIYERVQEAEGKLSHRTNERVREAEQRIAHSTDEKVKEAEGKIHDETAMGVSRIQRVVEDEAAKFNELEERNRKRSLDEYSRLKKEFRHNLIPYYKKELCVVPLAAEKAQFDEELSKIFAQPNLSYNTKQAVGVQNSKKGAPVKTYKDIFYKDDKEMKNIYILGEAGMGKSTFCLHLTSVWCDVMRESDNSSAEGSVQAEVFVPSVSNNSHDNQTINRSNKSTANRGSEEQTLGQLLEDDKGGLHGKGAVGGYQPLETNCPILKMDESESDSFLDSELLTRFDFVFTIILRKAKQDTKLDNLIDQQVIQNVRRSEKHDDAFIRRIMYAEKCLVVIDGLDEWPHSIPDRIYRENWTYITTTRPWKMADIKLQDSKVDVELSLKGITDWKYLIERAFVSLNAKHSQKTGTRVEKQPKEFEKAVRLSNLKQFLKVPVVLMQLISLWFSEGKLGNSSCEIYAGTIEMMMKRTILNKPNCLSELRQSETEIRLPMCFPQCKPQLCMNNISFILNLAKLAFYMLSQEDQSSSVVFDAEVVDQYLSVIERRVALDIGIVSECEVISMRDDRSTFNFLHKTFQEFLCAVFIATRHSDERNRYIATLFSSFGKRVSIFDVSEIFTFVCGMNPDAGVDMSQTISENMIGFNEYSDRVSYYQRLIEKGFSECVNNGHERPPLYYQHVRIMHGVKENSIQKHLLDVNDGRLLSLRVEYVSVWEVVGLVNRNSNLEYVSIDNTLTYLKKNVDIGDSEIHFPPSVRQVTLWNIKSSSGVIDMSSCDRLEGLECSDVNVSHMYINPGNLTACTLGGMSESSVMDVLTALASGAPRLQTLTMESCRCPDLPPRLDVTLTGLNKVSLYNVDIGASQIHFPPSVRQVSLCRIKSSSGVIDMSSCDRLEGLECSDVNVSHMYINPGNLTACTLGGMSESSVMDVLTALASGAPRLQTLTMESCRCPDLPPRLDVTLTGLNKVSLYNVDIGASQIHFPPSVRQVSLCRIKSSSGVIDMSSCDRLEGLECSDVNVSHMYINPGNLTACTLGGMSESSVMDVLTALASGAPRLQTLTMESCRCPDLPPRLDVTLTGLNKVSLYNVDIGASQIHFPPSVRQVSLCRIKSSSGVIDMSSCDRLEGLSCSDVNVSHIYINPGNLTACTLGDMSKSPVVRDVLTALASGAPRLQTLIMLFCRCPDLPPHLDLTLTGLEEVSLYNEDIGASEIHFPPSVRQVSLDHIKSSSGVIDMSACDRLEGLKCSDVNVSHIYINPGNLTACTLGDMSKSPVVRDVLTALASGAPRLQTLTMESCRCPDLPPRLDLTLTGLNKVSLYNEDIGASEIHFPSFVRQVSLDHIKSSSGVIDMSACDRLEGLKCSDVNVSHKYINPGNLTACTLDNMSKSPVVRDVLTALASGAPRLQTLIMLFCRCPDLPPHLDLTLTGLEEVSLYYVDIGASEIHFPPSVRQVSLWNIKSSSGVIDISSCDRLEGLKCSDVNVSHIYINPGNLTACTLGDMSKSPVVRDVLTALASGAPRLQTLTMESCRCPDLPPRLDLTLTDLNKVSLDDVDIGASEIHFPSSVRQVSLDHIESSSGVIDMSACDRLERLSCSDVNVSHIYINPGNLTACTLDNMSKSPVVRDVLTALASGAPRLQTLIMLFCRCPDLPPHLDLTLTGLEEVSLYYVDIGASEIHFPSSVRQVSLDHIESSSGVIDMSSCDRLEGLKCSDVNVSHMYINPGNLTACTLGDMSKSPVVRDVLTALASGAPRLQTLTMESCRCPDLPPRLDLTLTDLNKVSLDDVDIGASEIHFPSSVRQVSLDHIESSSGVIDMSACDRLERLSCSDVNVSHIYINPGNLTACTLGDISKSPVVRDVLTALASGSPRLQTLTMWSCSCPDLPPRLDLTLTGLNEVSLDDVDIGASGIHFPPSVRQVSLDHIKSSSGVIDMSACGRLEKLECRYVNVSHMYINPGNLTACTLSDMPESSVMDVLTALASGAPRLQKLTMWSCSCPDLPPRLDLTLTGLHEVWLKDIDIGASEIHFPPSVRQVTLWFITMPLRSWTCLVERLVAMPKSVNCTFTWWKTAEGDMKKKVTEYVSGHSGCLSVCVIDRFLTLHISFTTNSTI